MKFCFICSGRNPDDANFCINCSAPFRTPATRETINLKKIDRWIKRISLFQLGTMFGLVQFMVLIVGDGFMMRLGIKQSFMAMSLSELTVVFFLRGMIDTSMSLIILVGILRLTARVVSWGDPVQMAKRRLALMCVLTGVCAYVGLRIAPMNAYSMYDKLYILICAVGVGLIVAVITAQSWQKQTRTAG